jgi:hypothetical protein
MAAADEHDNAQDPSGWIDFLEALGIFESDDKDCLTDNKLIQLEEKCGGVATYFRGPSDVSGKPPLVRAVQLLLRQACWRHQGKPYRKLKLPSPLRKALRIARDRHGRPPLPELYHMLRRDLADYHQIDRDLKVRRSKALTSYAPQISEGELVGLPGVWRNGYGTPTPGTDIHTDVNLRLFANPRRIITASNWLTIGDLGQDEEDKEAVYDLKIKREAYARILASRGLRIGVPARQNAEGPFDQRPPPEPPQPVHIQSISPEVRELWRPATPWQGWPPAHVYLAQPALLLAAVPGSHDCSPDVVRAELWRAVEAGDIRYQIVVEAQIYVQPLSGLVQGQITDPQLWRRVDRVRGVLELPPGTVRVIKICEADALGHFQTWPRQQREAADPAAADTADETPTADASEAGEDVAAMPGRLLALEDLAEYSDLRARVLVLNSIRPHATRKLSETTALGLARAKYGTSLDARPALLKNITDSQRHRAWNEANKMHKGAQK